MKSIPSWFALYLRLLGKKRNEELQEWFDSEPLAPDLVIEVLEKQRVVTSKRKSS